jgi:broad specificity phosphatase PhoE
LSTLGEKQAIELGAGIARALRKPLSPRLRDLKKVSKIHTPSRIAVAVSPMRRALMTSLPVVSALEDLHMKNSVNLTRIEVVPFIFEVGGCYSEKDGAFVGHPGLSSDEVKKFIPSANVDESMHRGWWKGESRETEEEFEIRVSRTIEWIRNAAWDGNCDVLIMVTHQDFACSCLRRLANVPGLNWLYNTSLSSVTIEPILKTEYDPEAFDIGADGVISKVRHCRVSIDWLNAVDHLSSENIA